MPILSRRLQVVVLALVLSGVATPMSALLPTKLDLPLSRAAAVPLGQSKVVVIAENGASLDALAFVVQRLGGSVGRRLPIIHGFAATVPNAALLPLGSSSGVRHVALDRLVVSALERTGATVGATAVRAELGLDGSGVGIAVIDSGVAPGVDDLGDPAVPGSERIDQFVDFVNGLSTPYDDYGHGTHVAGIIAGNGFDSSGARSGLAPRARLVILKALNRGGQGSISNVIAALNYAVEHRFEFNIRLINLSVGSGVYESYNSDPLTLATKAAADAGIIVVAAAGNGGRNAQGRSQYRSITAPGNAPWVLTVGASSHMGTVDRTDDLMAAFSSRGPTAVNTGAKPDLVAPGVGIESLSAPNSTLYNSMSAYLLNGTVPTPYPPYLSLSGTSMAAPVVTGTVALMLQANPGLTPNAVKAILQYTAQVYPGYDALTQGAGFLNARGAVKLASYFADPAAVPYPSSDGWSRHIVWGNYSVSGGLLIADANAWFPSVVWGDTTTSSGGDVVWGVICTGGCDSTGAAWAQWSPRLYAGGAPPPSGDWDNVVWGSACGGADCPSGTTWSTSEGDTIVWGSTGGDTIVWGSGCTDPECYVLWNNQ